MIPCIVQSASYTTDLDTKGRWDWRGEGHTVWVELLDSYHIPTQQRNQAMEGGGPIYTQDRV